MTTLALGTRPEVTAPAPSFPVRLACDLGRFQDTPAVFADGRWLTYSELDRLVGRAAATLGSTRRLVAVPARNTLGSLTWALAVLRGGHVLLMCSGTAADAEILPHYNPDVTVEMVGPEFAPRFARDGSAHELHPELALLLSTSGSTGSPKLARLSAENLDSNAEAIAAYLGLDAADRAITTLPLAYCYGLSTVTSHLSVGAGIILTELSVVDECFWGLVNDQHATTLAGVPHTFELLERSGFHGRHLPSLRRLTQAGGKMPPDRVRRFAESAQARAGGGLTRRELFVMYGQTEATARMAYLPPHLAATHPGTVGIPIPGGSVRIDHESSSSLGQGTVPERIGSRQDVGELIYRGPNVMLGYAERPEDLARGRDISELRTGDLARINEAGLIEIVGRRGRMAKIFGLRIDLPRVEAQLEGAVVTPVGSQMVVTVEGSRDSADLDRVASLCAATAGIPASCVVTHSVAQLPRLASGKPDMRSIGALAVAAAGEPSAPAVFPSPTDSLIRTFGAVLHRNDVTPDDSFVSLGGDSLSYVSMSTRLEQQLGELPRGWHLMTIRDLSQRPKDPAETRWWTWVETSVALRALAIALVVGSHVGIFDIRGGAHLMLGIAGYNYARFHLTLTDRLARMKHTSRSLMRFGLPAALWMAAAALLLADYSWGVFGVTFSDRQADAPEWRYWFIEVLALSLVLAGAATALPGLHRLQRARPLAFAMSLLAVAVLIREATREPSGPGALFTVWAGFWVFCLGWAIAALQGARLPRRVREALSGPAPACCGEILASALIITLVPTFFERPIRSVVVAGGLLALVWLPRVSMPRLAVPLVGSMAAGSMFIYLSHWQTYPPLADIPLLAFVSAVIAGILINSGVSMLRRP